MHPTGDRGGRCLHRLHRALRLDQRLVLMDRRLYPVEIFLGENSRIYTPEFQTEAQYSAAWKRVLLIAHVRRQLGHSAAPISVGTQLLDVR